MMSLPPTDPRRLQWTACESPIEQLLCHGLFAMLGCKAVAGKYQLTRRAEMADLSGSTPTAFVFTQQSMGAYRADFLIVMIDPAARLSHSFVVECDGKGYHLSERDQPRDTRIIATGAGLVLRITGSEIVTDLPAAVERVARVLRHAGILIHQAVDLPKYGSFLFPKTEGEYRRERREVRDEILRRERDDAAVARYFEQERTGTFDDECMAV